MPSPSNFFSNFVQHAANVGYQRSNRFIVLFQGPGISPSQDFKNTSRGPSIGFNQLLNQEHQKRLAITCVSATLSGKSLMTNAFTGVGSGPKTYFPYGENYTNDASFTFNCSRDMFERQYFTKWVQNIIDPSSHDVMLYSNYAKPWKVLIAMLPPNVGSFEKIAKMTTDTRYVDNIVPGEGTSDKNADPDFPIYYVRLNEVYPVEISENELSSDDKDKILTFTVKVKYKSWEDPIINYIERGKELSRDQIGVEGDAESPFGKFLKIARDVSRYSNPSEFRQLIVDRGLDSLSGMLGAESVEKMAQAGRVVDVYRQTERTVSDTLNRLIGPLGRVL